MSQNRRVRRTTVALLLCSLTFLLPAAARPATRPGPEVKIQVVSITVAAQHRDRSPKGISNGDTVVYHDRLVNAVAQFGKEVGDRVGTDSGTFTYTSDATARYQGTCNLPDGSIILRGNVLAAYGGQELIPVVGGTGRYKGAKGYMLVGPGRHAVLNTYEFTVERSVPTA
jgi:hypothetical protein